METEKQLLDDVKGGSQAAMHRLYERYVGYAMAVALTRKQSRLTFVDEVPEEVPDEDPEVERVPPAELTRMIGELPEGYRLVLNMFVFEQRSHKEIAEQLGIKESSSASQYLRAKKLLAKKINDYLNTLNEKEYE